VFFYLTQVGVRSWPDVSADEQRLGAKDFSSSARPLSPPYRGAGGDARDRRRGYQARTHQRSRLRFNAARSSIQNPGAT